MELSYSTADLKYRPFVLKCLDKRATAGHLYPAPLACPAARRAFLFYAQLLVRLFSIFNSFYMKLSLPFLPATARRLLLAVLLSGTAATAAQAQNNVGIGTNAANPAPSAVLDLSSTSQGLLAPRMTAAQRGSIGSPATGLLVYQTDGTAGFYVYSGSAWTALSGSGATGPAGPAGSQGPIGNTGPAGPQGTTGATGAQGPIGNTGAAGAQGPIGNTGATGAAGPQGLIGNTGPAGATGAQGPIGNTGPAGPQGAAGNAGAVGATGPIGPQGPIGNTGAAGPTGSTGATGATGPQGAAGQGVPTGGTAGQVLSKIDATNYNTQWTTPSTGGGTFPSIELSTAVTASQNIATLAGSNTYTPLVFSSSNGTGAALTSGNTWNGSVFTVGSSGAGTYQITVHMMPIPPSQIGVQYYIDKNSAIGSTTSTTAPYALSTYNLNASGSNYRFNSTISTIIYLAAGDQITLRAQSISTGTTANTNPDGSNNLQIVRLK